MIGYDITRPNSAVLDHRIMEPSVSTAIDDYRREPKPRRALRRRSNAGALTENSLAFAFPNHNLLP